MGTAHGPEYQALADITRPTVERYCEKRGYDFLYDPNRTDKDACKVALYKEAYATGRYGPDDVFCWIDTDALIMNSEIRIEHIVYWLTPRSIHYMIGTDVNGLNSGFFIARFSPEALLFQTVANTISVGSGWSDQEGLIQTAVKEPHRSIYREVPGKVFNCNLYDRKGWALGEYGRYINEYQDGDFVLHLAGVEEPERTNTLRAYAELAR